jgi:hypothetical protein
MCGLSGPDHGPRKLDSPLYQLSDLSALKHPTLKETRAPELVTKKILKEQSQLKKALSWIAEAYTSKGGTLLIGLAASCVALPGSWTIGRALQEIDFPKRLSGFFTMGGSMLVWDALYSAGLYFFYDRKEVLAAENTSRQEIFQTQLKKYAINCLKADFGWIASYQSIYFACAIGMGVSTPVSAAMAHGLSILVIDILRPPLLKLNKTLLRDQNK